MPSTVACGDGREAQRSMGDGMQARAAGSVALLCCQGEGLGVYLSPRYRIWPLAELGG